MSFFRLHVSAMSKGKGLRHIMNQMMRECPASLSCDHIGWQGFGIYAEYMERCRRRIDPLNKLTGNRGESESQQVLAMATQSSSL
jgi:hypothetical protein